MNNEFLNKKLIHLATVYKPMCEVKSQIKGLADKMQLQVSHYKNMVSC